MTKHVIYFSRTHTSKRIAEKLAGEFKCPVSEITDDQKWSGIFGYIKAGYYASADKPVSVCYDPQALEADQVIIVSPLWAGGPAPAIRTLLRQEPGLIPHLVLTNDGSDIHKAFKRTQTLFPRIKDLYGITKKMNHEDDMIQRIVHSLQ